MAEVPELSDLLMDNSKNDELFISDDVPNKTKDDKYSHCCRSGVTRHSKIKLEVEICYDDDQITPITEEGDDDSNKDCDEEGDEEAARVRFLYNQTSEHTIRDSNMKPLKQEGNDSIVVSPLGGDNANLELKIIVNTYLENLNDTKRPVTLGIAGQKLYLCCTPEGITHQLPSLTEVDDIKEKRSEDDLLPFIFYYRKDASLFSFESAAFPGYYLSASQKEGEKLQLRQKSEVFMRDFRLTPHLA